MHSLQGPSSLLRANGLTRAVLLSLVGISSAKLPNDFRLGWFWRGFQRKASFSVSLPGRTTFGFTVCVLR